MNTTERREFLNFIAHNWLKAFPDLGWKGDPLKIVIQNREVRYIRLGLQEKEFFHLESICLHCFNSSESNLNLTTMEGVDVKCSSTWSEAVHLEDGRGFLSDSPSIGFHTAFEENPWVCVDLGGIREVDVIRLCNRRDQYASRARSLLVDVSHDGEHWSTVHNALDRRNQFITWVVACYMDAGGSPTSVFIYQLANFLKYMVGWELDKCKEVFVDSLEIFPYQAQLNMMLARFEREITNHGIRRSFRFWTDEEKISYLAKANQVIASLQKVSCNVSYGFGFVLGYVREGDLIGHDDDVDIIVAFDVSDIGSLSAALSIVENQLKEDGFSVSGNFLSHRWVCSGDVVALDVFVGLIEGEHVSFYPSNRKTCLYKNVYPSRAVRFLGQTLLMPCNLIEYLECTYGVGWRKPDHNFSHAWDETQYADVA